MEGLERTADDVMWMPAPLNHAVGFFHGLVAPMLLGGRSVLMQDFAVKDAIDLINAEGATWCMPTPFIYDIVKYLDATLTSRCPPTCCTPAGGALVPGALIDRAHNHDILLCERFRPTRAARTFQRLEQPRRERMTTLHPFPGIEAAASTSRETMWPRRVQGEHISRVACTSSSAT